MLGIGFLRLFFIISIMNFHSKLMDRNLYWNYFFNGKYAVQLSLILSGFYMEMVYPKYKNAISFYFSRIIRIFPCYWLNLFANYYLNNKNFLKLIPQFPNIYNIRTKSLIRFTDFFLIFKDLLFFLYQDNNGKIHFINVKARQHSLANHIINFPSWSMGMEISWYLLLPLFSKFNNVSLFFIFFLSFSKRSYDYTFKNRNVDAYHIHFFPYELALFIIGQLEYRLYTKYFIHSFKKIGKSLIPTLFISIFLVYYDFTFNYLGQYFILVLFILFLPYLFFVSADSKLDRWFGERIYFMYIWHYLVQNILNKYIKPKLSYLSDFLIIQFLLCFILSIFFEKFIQSPINKLFKPRYQGDVFLNQIKVDQQNENLLNQNFLNTDFT